MSDNHFGNDDHDIEILAETDNYAVLLAEDADGESVYNIELGNVTLHFFEDEWEELVSLIQQAGK